MSRRPTARREIAAIIRDSWATRWRAPTRQEIVEARDGSPVAQRTRKAVARLIAEGVLREDGGRIYLVERRPQSRPMEDTRDP